MTADYLSYKRATTVSLIGLVIQAALAGAMLAYGIYGADPAARWASFAMLLGLPVWGSLALVFNQHKLERLEAAEAEAYRGSAAAASTVFEERPGDENAQANRLAWMHRWFLPAVSLLVGGALLGLGVYFWQTVAKSEFTRPQFQGWAIALGVGIAVIGFIFARFVAGMAKQKVWSLLNAGAASAVACALFGAAVSLAHFLSLAGLSDALLSRMRYVVAGAMVVLGAEVFFHFLRLLYTPRRQGEYLRPAFDSRLLAFLAAPDAVAKSIGEAVNYQFGFDVSSTWFYRLVARSFYALVLLAIGTVWLMSAFVVVKPDEKGLLLRGGRLESQLGPGLVTKRPWPLDSVVTFPASAVNEIVVGTLKAGNAGPILWTNEHSPNELFLIVQPSVGQRSERSEAAPGGDGSPGRADGQVGRDLALLAAEVPIHYTVRDMEKYHRLAQDAAGDDPEKMRRQMLEMVASAVTIEHLATFTVDELLGAKRVEIAAQLREIIQKAFDARLNAGVEVLFVGVAGVHPEKNVSPAFESVVQADQQRLKFIEQAEAERTKTLSRVAGDVRRAREIVAGIDDLQKAQASGAEPAALAAQEARISDLILAAGGEAARLIAEARAERWRRVTDARGAAVLGEGRLVAFLAAPGVYKLDLYLQALRSAARGARVWIVPPGDTQLRLDGTAVQADLSGFRPPAPEGPAGKR
ncbi:MAG: hypothetical protein IBJ11_07160 [Phycisphaerales bacterium]|nr:hypothetical protein [Phycisphaerales bacterium]